MKNQFFVRYLMYGDTWKDDSDVYTSVWECLQSDFSQYLERENIPHIVVRRTETVRASNTLIAFCVNILDHEPVVRTSNGVFPSTSIRTVYIVEGDYNQIRTVADRKELTVLEWFVGVNSMQQSDLYKKFQTLGVQIVAHEFKDKALTE